MNDLEIIITINENHLYAKWQSYKLKVIKKISFDSMLISRNGMKETLEGNAKQRKRCSIEQLAYFSCLFYAFSISYLCADMSNKYFA